MPTLFLSLGANLGDCRATLNTAVQAIDEQIGEVVRRSSFYETAPWGFESDHQFVNLMLEVATELSVEELLQRTQSIERALGRAQKTADHYADRLIDIDLIDYDALILDSDLLRLPHPHMHLRRFVLEPLREIAPDWRHPILGQSVDELLALLDA